MVNGESYNQVLVIGSGNAANISKVLKKLKLEELENSSCVIICVTEEPKVQLIPLEELVSNMEKVISDNKNNMMFQIPVFDYMSKKVGRDFREKQHQREIAFRETSRLCRKIVKGNRGFRGRSCF